MGCVPTHFDTVQSVPTLSDCVGEHLIDKGNREAKLSMYLFPGGITKTFHNVKI